MNNLSYLKDQVKGYDADGDKSDEDEEGEEEELNDDVDDNENVLVTMSNNGTISFESSSNSSGNEIESSGDGEDESDLENKSSYIPIPNNSDGMVSSQLQRLSQLVRKVNNNQHADLTADDLNQYLSLHKLVHQKYSSNTKAEPVPHNKLIEDHHLKQILDLQKRLNKLANSRDAYSTPPTPVKFTVTGNGGYPADATTLHIKATNGLKSPQFPDVAHSTSQIVVNRPGGSVVFRLPHSDYPTKKPNKKKPENHISEDTLKTLLELTKNMANQAPNTPNFVHSLPSSNGGYAPPIIQPVLYNFPWEKLTMSSLFDTFNPQKFDKIQNDDGSMEKISSVKVSVPATPNGSSEPDDTGPTTIIHNHVPITIAHPSPSNSIVNRFHAASTTARPTDDRYDSYGNKKPEHTDLNNYYPYPPFSENQQQNPSIIQKHPSVASTMTTYYSSPFSTQQTSYNANVEEPHYIQIAQSQPDHYVPVYPSNAIVNGMRPIPTFASINGGYTQKFFSAYTPQPHISENNVNDIVHINQKSPYPTLRPVNYVPIATASSPTPSYVESPSSFGHFHKHQQIADKIDHFIDSNEPNDSDGSNEANSNQYENNDDYVNSNVDQHSNENVMDVLANYNSHKKTDSLENISGMGGSGNSGGGMAQIIPNIGGETKPSNKYKPTQIQGNHKQFVNLNGNFMSLETYQQTIEPYIQKNSALSSQIEVLTCATGVRQANSTDCTRYFVCNEKTGKILSYSCPPYTAFSGDTKICTADTYSKCFLGDLNQIDSKFSPQMSMLEAHRIKSEAVKAQQLAHLIKMETNKILSSANQVRYKQQMMNGGKSTTQTIQPTPIPTQPAKIVQQQLYRKPQINQTPITPSASPQRQNVKNRQTNKKPQGKRKIPCRKEGKLVDNLSQHHYFLCFKDQQQKMRARRLQCPAKLTFCPSSLVCTSKDRCTRH